MPADNSGDESGFTAEERAAMKARAAELRAQDLLDAIAAMAPKDRMIAERVHMTVSAAAPDLLPKTWYGMPAWADADGKAVIFFQNSGKFKYRYSTLGFQDSAHLDDGDIWPVSYAITDWTPAVEKKVTELVKTAIS
jgi:uncharacterized protein YdhG (YjbR/CyaY superfamily)